MKNAERKLNTEYSLVQASYWMSFCLSVTYAGVYLLTLGYTNTHVGLILALGNTGGFVLASLLASMIDRHERITVFKVISAVLALQAASAALLAAAPRRCPLNAAAFVLNVALCMCGNSMNTKICVDLNHGGARVNYSTARGVGSLGYVLLSAVLGGIITKRDVYFLPYAALALLALRFIFNFMTAKDAPEIAPAAGAGNRNKSSSLAGFFRKYKRYCLFTAGTVLVFAGHNAVTNFMINVTENIGGDAETMGSLSAFMASVEIPMMFAFARLRKKFKIHRMIRFALFVYILKGFSIALARSPGALYAAFTLQMFSFAVITPALVDYTALAIPFEDSAKGQSISFGANTMGSVVSSFAAGRLYDVMPVKTVLIIAALTTTVGVLISWFSVRNVEKNSRN